MRTRELASEIVKAERAVIDPWEFSDYLWNVRNPVKDHENELRENPVRLLRSMEHENEWYQAPEFDRVIEMLKAFCKKRGLI